MDVEEFVSETLKQINSGLMTAGSKLPGLQINPSPYASAVDTGYMVATDSHRPIFFVKFDLSVTVQSKIEGTAGAKITLLGIGGGKGEATGSVDQTRVQRIEFSVPVTFVSELKVE